MSYQGTDPSDHAISRPLIPESEEDVIGNVLADVKKKFADNAGALLNLPTYQSSAQREGAVS
jgi:hypothetical protein